MVVIILYFRGNLEVAQVLLDKDVNVNAVTKFKDTPLHYACWKGQTATANFLLDNGAFVNFNTGDYKNTPLHLACWSGHVSTAQLLLEHGADRTLRNRFGLTAFHYAKIRGHTEVTELF